MASFSKAQHLVGPGKYDAVLRVDRFLDVFDFSKGWRLAVATESASALKACAAVRVSVIGNCNVGKTWLISKLCESSGSAGQRLELPSGDSVRTEGLSLKVCRTGNGAEQCAFLDTAGLNAPVTSVAALGHTLQTVDKDKLKAMEHMMQELKRHEDLVRRVAFEFAQVHLVVLGYMSFSDQLQIVQLIDQVQAAAASSHKEVVVVHNLKDMTYKDFKKQRDAVTGLTYLKSMKKLFLLRYRKATVSGGKSWIDELYGAFGADGSGGTVRMRHVFLTRDDEQCAGEDPDACCRNADVLTYLRVVMQAGVPKMGHLASELTQCVSRCVLPMVRLPAKVDVDLRLDEERGRIVAGSLTADKRLAEKTTVHETTQTRAVLQAQQEAHAAMDALQKEPASAALQDAVEEADKKLGEAQAEAAASVACSVPDVAALEPLLTPHGVTALSVLLTASSARIHSDVIQYNTSRVRGYWADEPVWVCKVTVAAPALKADELQRLRNEVVWGDGSGPGAQGVWMEARGVLQEPTAKLCFTIKLRNQPERQLELLTKAGKPVADGNGKVNGSCITFATGASPVLQEKGSRAFTSGCEEIEAPVAIHTDFRNCVEDLRPVIHYGRGLLTVVLLCELSREDRRHASNKTWVENADPTAMVVDRWDWGANGSDEDLDA